METRFRKIFIESSNNFNNTTTKEMKDEEESEETKQESKNQGSNNRGMIQWNTEEKKLFIDCLKRHGRDWEAIAEAFPNKTDKQCRT